MKFVTIDKKDWTGGIQKGREAYQLFGPVKDKNGCIIKQLDADVMPQMDYIDSVMSAKSALFPQSEKIR